MKPLLTLLLAVTLCSCAPGGPGRGEAAWGGLVPRVAGMTPAQVQTPPMSWGPGERVTFMEQYTVPDADMERVLGELMASARARGWEVTGQDRYDIYGAAYKVSLRGPALEDGTEHIYLLLSGVDAATSAITARGFAPQ